MHEAISRKNGTNLVRTWIGFPAEKENISHLKIKNNKKNQICLVSFIFQIHIVNNDASWVECFIPRPLRPESCYLLLSGAFNKNRFLKTCHNAIFQACQGNKLSLIPRASCYVILVYPSCLVQGHHTPPPRRRPIRTVPLPIWWPAQAHYCDWLA